MVAVALGAAVAGVVVAMSGAPVAWLMLAITGFSSMAVVVRAVLQRRYFEPLTIVAAVTFISFAIRPLQLFLGAKDLQSWVPGSLDDVALKLDHSELALFVTGKLDGPLEPALARTIAAVTLFFLLFLAGYALPIGRRLRERIARVGPAVRLDDVRSVVFGCFAVGLAAQALAVALAGGPSAAFDGQLDAKVLNAGSPLVMHFLLGFWTIGLLIWAVWDRPVSRRARLAFLAATLEVLTFWAFAGSRTRVFLPLLMIAVVSHELWRPWARRAVVTGVVACVALGGALLSVRQATADDPLPRALLQAPQYVVNPEGLLNDFTEFDDLFYATSAIPKRRDYAYGKGMVDALASYVPGALLADKPESTDQEFRRFIWGDAQEGGRPYTIVGDFYNDFGFPGIAVGAFLFGIAGRLLLSLLRGPAGWPGRRYRVALYAVGATIFYMALATAYTLPLGFVLEYALPLLVAVFVFGRLSGRTTRRPGRRPIGAATRGQADPKARTAA
jgi:hypothetical protein